MYETHFRFHERPFAASPRVDRYFPAATIEAARQALSRCVERAEGAGMLVGPPGSGKTLLCQLLAEQFRGAFEIALLSNGHLGNRRELLQAILFELKLPFKRMDEGELRLSLVDHLSEARTAGGGLLLILDEAHTFPTRLLEEVRLITNLVHHGEPRVRLVLAGAAILEERFASPRLAAFSQRIASRSYLEAFSAAETRQYVISQLAAAGGDARGVFTADALDALYRASGGIPRLVNQLCDHALILAFANGRSELDAAGIEEAWADLQQLPTPWNDGPTPASAAPAADELIEFGGLDDEGQAPERAKLDSPPDADRRPAILLSQIEDHLTSLDNDFEPVATIGPAGALPAPAASHLHAGPLFEPFAEEEVLVDRYAASAISQFGQRRSVYCREGAALSVLLQPHVHSSAVPELSVVASAARPEREAAHAKVLPLAAHTIEASAAPAAFDVRWSTADGDLAAPAAFEPALALSTELWRNGVPEASDDDVMIVEDDPRHEPAETKVRGIPQARRQEYRQLFSLLRKGP